MEIAKLLVKVVSELVNGKNKWLYKLFRGFVKITFNEVSGVLGKKDDNHFFTLN